MDISNFVLNKDGTPDSNKIAFFNKIARDLGKTTEAPYYKNRFSNTIDKPRGFNYSLENVKAAKEDLSENEMRAISNYFYEANISYRRIVDHFSSIFKYYYVLDLEGLSTSKQKKEQNQKIYQKTLKFLNELLRGGILKEISTKVLIDGCYYGYLNIFDDDSCCFTRLNPEYCRTRYRGKYGLDIVEYNLNSLRTYPEEEKKAVLKNFPSYVQVYYEQFISGQAASPWVDLPIDRACCFKLTGGSMNGNFDNPPIPPLYDTIIDILNFDSAKDIELSRDEQELEKLLIQKLTPDEDGDFSVFLEEMAVMHEATTNIFKDNPFINVLTTIADIDLKDTQSSTRASTATNNNILKMMLPKYETAGLSSELFYSTTATSLILSLNNATSFMADLINKYGAWLSVACLGRLSYQDIVPVVSILPITWYNEKTLLDMYTKNAQYGYSKILPYVASGKPQSTFADTMELENILLDMPEKLIPLRSTYTESGDKLSKEEATGRPPLDIEEKSEETIETEEGRTEVASSE